MAANPYDDQTYSGYQGSQTPVAVQNQQGQAPRPAQNNSSAGSPYEAILSHAIASASNVQAQAISNPGGGADDNSGGGGVPPETTTPAPTPQPTAPTRGRPSAPPPQYSAANPPPKPQGTEDPEIAATWYRQFNYVNPAFGNITAADVMAYRADPKGMTIAQWYLAGNRGNNPSGVPDGFGGPPILPPEPDPTPNVDTGAGPDPGPITGGGNTPSPVPTTHLPTPSAPMSGPTDWGAILKQLQSMMGPQFNFESTQLNRRMNAQGALTGDLSSGGFGEVSGRANAQLSADQGNRLSGMLNTDWQNELARELQKYGIDVGSADSRYGADKGVEAAGLHANAASAAAEANLRGTMAGLSQQERESKRQWDEYWGNVGLGARGQDYDFLGRLFSGANQFSPEMLNQGAIHDGQFPGYSYFPAVDWTKYFHMGAP